MSPLLILALTFAPWALWALYVLVMGIYRAHMDKRLTRLTYAMALPWVVLGFALDVAVNLTVASLLFLELPQELLVTSRLKRHITAPCGWRNRLAALICDRMLDVFDPTGNHC